MADGRCSRRRFLKGAAAALATTHFIRTSALGGDEKAPASERVTLGHIGVGGRGSGLLQGFLSCQRCRSVAVADCFASRRDGWAKRIEGMAYHDFRELLDRKDIDAVVVATPDHWHVPIAMAAIRAGKDVYVEKPLGLTIEQDQAIRKLCKEKRAVFQYGTQQRSSAHCRHGCELVRNGRIGKILSIDVVAPNGISGGSTVEIPVPADLDYDLWLGPAPRSPYTADRCTANGTYHVYDNSIGFIAGWGAHPLDILLWGYDIQKAGTVQVEGKGLIPKEGLFNTVINWDVTYRYANGLTVTLKPGGDATIFNGTEGWIRVSRGGNASEPKTLLESKINPDEIHLLESGRQDQNFVDAVRTRGKTVSPIDDSVYSDFMSHLGDICIRTGRRITWDQEKEVIVGDAEASKMLHRPMRATWTL
ncbi:MAG: Gfo/Idh/MocA family oxidoreductase [Planctomycetes bacterium]|nr:Gfo/Idh/MocA family oxidoreductase [Planctomycetota bacterium]